MKPTEISSITTKDLRIIVPACSLQETHFSFQTPDWYSLKCWKYHASKLHPTDSNHLFICRTIGQCSINLLVTDWLHPTWHQMIASFQIMVESLTLGDVFHLAFLGYMCNRAKPFYVLLRKNTTLKPILFTQNS